MKCLCICLLLLHLYAMSRSCEVVLSSCWCNFCVFFCIAKLHAGMSWRNVFFFLNHSYSLFATCPCTIIWVHLRGRSYDISVSLFIINAYGYIQFEDSDMLSPHGIASSARWCFQLRTDSVTLLPDFSRSRPTASCCATTRANKFTLSTRHTTQWCPKDDTIWTLRTPSWIAVFHDFSRRGESILINKQTPPYPCA